MKFFLTSIVLLALLFCSVSVTAQQRDSLRYPIVDRRADAFSAANRNPYALNDTSLIKQTIEFDPATKQYFIIEKIGNKLYRTPTYLTYEDFWRIQSKQAEKDYFKKRADALMLLNQKTKRPPMKVGPSFWRA